MEDSISPSAALHQVPKVIQYANFDKQNFAEEIQSHIEERQTVDFMEQKKCMAVCEKRIGELEKLIAKNRAKEV